MLTKATFRRSTERACAHEDQVLGAARISCHHVLSQAAPRHHPHPSVPTTRQFCFWTAAACVSWGRRGHYPAGVLALGLWGGRSQLVTPYMPSTSYLVHEEQEQASEMLERAAREVAKASEEDARPVRLWWQRKAMVRVNINPPLRTARLFLSISTWGGSTCRKTMMWQRRRLRHKIGPPKIAFGAQVPYFSDWILWLMDVYGRYPLVN